MKKLLLPLLVILAVPTSAVTQVALPVRGALAGGLLHADQHEAAPMRYRQQQPIRQASVLGGLLDFGGQSQEKPQEDRRGRDPKLFMENQEAIRIAMNNMGRMEGGTYVADTLSTADITLMNDYAKMLKEQGVWYRKDVERSGEEYAADRLNERMGMAFNNKPEYKAHRPYDGSEGFVHMFDFHINHMDVRKRISEQRAWVLRDNKKRADMGLVPARENKFTKDFGSYGILPREHPDPGPEDSVYIQRTQPQDTTPPLLLGKP